MPTEPTNVFRRQNTDLPLLKVEHHGDGGKKEGEDKDPDAAAAEEVVSSSSSSPASPSATTTSTSSTSASSVTSGEPTPGSVTVSSSGLPTPTLDSALTFNIPSHVNTCNNLTITWNYTGQLLLPLTLFIDDAAQWENATDSSHLPFTSQPANTNTALRVLTTGIPSNAGAYNWETVDLVGGAYVLDGVSTSGFPSAVAVVPALFNVVNSTNTTCLTIPPAQVIHKHRTLARADSIGIIFAGIAGVVLLTVAFLFPRFWQKPLPSRKERPSYPRY